MSDQGALYEQWVKRLLPEVCAAAGVALPRDAEIRERSTKRGHYQLRQEVDLLVESEHQLIVVECKDRGYLPHPYRLDSYWSLAEIAAAHPEQQVIGILVSSGRLTSATPDFFGRLQSTTGVGADFVRHLPNLATPIALLTLPARIVCGWALLYEYVGSGVKAHVLRAEPVGGLDVGHMEHALQHEPDLSGRLFAALSLLSAAVPEDLRLSAGLEASICLLHIGLPEDALEFARWVQDAARLVGSGHHLQNAYYVEELARMTISRSRRPGQRRSGSTAVHRLERALDEMTAVDTSNVRGVLGAWHGLVGDDIAAESLLASARAEAYGLDGIGGAYSSFLAELRTAEVAVGESRIEWLNRAGLWVPELHPKHRVLAAPLLAAASETGAPSIGAIFPSPEVVEIKRDLTADVQQALRAVNTPRVR